MAGSGDGDNKSTVSEEAVFSPASRLSRKPSILSTTSTTTTAATVAGNSSSNVRGSSADSINAQLQLEQLMQSSEKLLHEKNHPTSTTTASSNSPNSSNVNNEDVPDISIVHLDEAFKLEVDALEAESAQQAAINNNNSSGNNAARPVSMHSNGRGSPYPGPPSSQGGSPGHPTTGNLVLFFTVLFCVCSVLFV